MKTISWGIIGCGDVNEIKSGPAFNKINGSVLSAVMRRDKEKAADYARRHQVPSFYGDAQDLINDPGINAVYVATPPGPHEEYTIASLTAGKPVYVEKPMSLDAESCRRMAAAAAQTGTKLTVAHYRRALPMFRKVKTLLNEIGDVSLVTIRFFQPKASALVANSEENWRVDPAISGGGLFHDMAPHHIDLMLYFFGEPLSIHGHSANQAKMNRADDIVMGQLVFPGEVFCTGAWCFNVPKEFASDECEIIGSLGKIVFPFHGNEVSLHTGGEVAVHRFEHPQHIQQPMIAEVVRYFSGEAAENPCPAEAGIKVLTIIDRFTGK
ncbi:Gfo/Idh/MocA family protein [Hufsiella ginkgonis]|uniref:Gfo/Idh/MocA family oxidoreductase n=1 Tax=Hufsiella ginkgonis TaxID=2695274 RepID=A0A7K1XVD1_9SPHI|nr:Gfo/Idh/MocA family oxidoreductase [Hufsiella ginkgonis]MXV14757.1 Gfo/Idh/MocA family oxidoreductase [Hufsiella ginkgonis]